LLFFTAPFTTIATDPPDPGGSPQVDDPPLGDGAPVGSGLFVLLVLSTFYGGRKLLPNKEGIN